MRAEPEIEDAEEGVIDSLARSVRFEAKREARLVTALRAPRDAGADIVSGWKKKRYDPWHKVFPSRVFNWLVGRLTGVKLHDHNCGFKCYRRDVIEEVRIRGELHRFVPVLAAAQGFKVDEVEVNHRPRKFGSSNYGVTRIVKGLLDLLTVLFLTSYRQRPQHLLGAMGLTSFFLGFAGVFYLAVYWVVKNAFGFATWPAVHERPILHYAIALLLLGGQFIAIGILAELITATAGRIAPTWCCRAPPIPRRTALT